MTFLYVNTDLSPKQATGISTKEACGEMKRREVRPLQRMKKDFSFHLQLIFISVHSLFPSVGFLNGYLDTTNPVLSERCVFNNVTKQIQTLRLGPEFTEERTLGNVDAGTVVLGVFSFFFFIPVLSFAVKTCLVATRFFVRGERAKLSEQHAEMAELLVSLEEANRSVPDECIPFLLTYLSEESLQKLSFSQTASIWKANPNIIVKLLEKGKLPAKHRIHWQFLISLEKAKEEAVIDLLQFPHTRSLYGSEPFLIDLTIALLAKKSLLMNQAIKEALAPLLDQAFCSYMEEKKPDRDQLLNGVNQKFLSYREKWKPDREELLDRLLQGESLKEAVDALLPPKLTVEVRVGERAFVFSKQSFLENGYNGHQLKCLNLAYPEKTGEMLKEILEKGYVKSPGIVDAIQLMELAQELGLSRVEQHLKVLLIDILLAKSCLPTDHQEVLHCRKKGKLVSFYNEFDRSLAERLEDSPVFDLEDQCRFASDYGLLHCKAKLFTVLQQMFDRVCDKKDFTPEEIGKGLELLLTCVGVLNADQLALFTFLNGKIEKIVKAKSSLLTNLWALANDLQNEELKEIVKTIFSTNKERYASLWRIVPEELSSSLQSVVVLDS